MLNLIHSKELVISGQFNIPHLAMFLVFCSVNEHKCLCETCDLEAVGDSEEGQTTGEKRGKRAVKSCTYKTVVHYTKTKANRCTGRWWRRRCYDYYSAKPTYCRELCCHPLNNFVGYITVRLY